MARIRTIKPEFWTDDKILQISPNSRLLFLGMLNFADDEGNIEGSWRSIKARIFPMDDLPIPDLLDELEAIGLVTSYAVESNGYLHIQGFNKHQKIDKRALPRCPKYVESSPNSPESPRIPPTEVVREGKGREVVKEVKPIEHPEPDAPSQRDNFEWLWNDYPEKKGKEKAWLKFKNQVTTPRDYESICVALVHYKQDMERIRANGHPDRAWQHGSTWFNHYWKDYVNYEPPPEPTIKSPPDRKREVGDRWLERSTENDKKGISDGTESVLELRGFKPG